MNSGISEIQQHILHQDYSLALRRLLDVSLYTNNDTLIKESIAISKQYSEKCKHKTLTAAEEQNMLVELPTLLAKLDAAIPEVNFTNEEILNAKQVSKVYSKGGFRLEPLDINVKQGEIIGVVGENGNGKTTLLSALGGQLNLSGGAIDYPLFPQADLYEVRSRIAFIPQRIARWHGYLKDNLHFSAAISETYGRDNELMVEYILERLGLNNYRHLTWDQISSGYRTRFEIARILLQKPSLLILDEPLANLDINTQEIILNDLRFMAKSAVRPFGIILSSQQLHEVEKVADKVIVLRQGKYIHSQDTSEAGRQATTEFVIEIETKNTREELMNVFEKDQIKVAYNGGFFQLTSEQLTADTMLQFILQAGTKITYFRDITFSTKRFF